MDDYKLKKFRVKRKFIIMFLYLLTTLLYLLRSRLLITWKLNISSLVVVLLCRTNYHIQYTIDYLTAHLNFHNVIMVILLTLPYLIISFNGTNFERSFWRSLSNYFVIQNLRGSCNNIKINQNFNFFELVKSCYPFRFL